MKVLRVAFSRDPERTGRCQREAELMVSLHQPDIAAIYSIVESDHARALLVEAAEFPFMAMQ